MEIHPELLQQSTELAKIIGRSSVQLIGDKIKLAKSKKDSNEMINNLVEIINQLISEKNQLIQIAQAFDEKITAQKISNEEIEYITTAIIPLVEQILNNDNNDDKEKMMNNLEIIKPLLSKDTFNILQLLGFNFKQAIGQPLTELVRKSINNVTPVSSEKYIELQIARELKESEFYKVLQDVDAYERLLDFENRNSLD